SGYFDPSYFEVEVFTGFLRPGTSATIVVVPNDLGFTGQIALAPLWNRTDAVAPDSARVRAVLTTSGGYNVYFVPSGQPPTVPFLQGCYLDWPYGVTDYATRPSGAFDIVLTAKGGNTVAARFPVVPEAGQATTYILAGISPASLRVLTLIDH